MGRFLPTVQQRMVVTKWDPTDPQTESLLTFLDRRATNRVFRAEFGGPASMSGQVWSNDPEINILNDDNYTGTGDAWKADYPFLAEGVRLLRWFRKRRPTDDWEIRFGGFMQLTNDRGDHNTGRTDFTAWDPWQYLMRRPVYRIQCLTNDCFDGTFGVDWDDYGNANREDAIPSPAGVRFPAGYAIEDIPLELLRRQIVNDGPCGIDAGTAWGGTAFYNGTIETVGTLDSAMTFQQGTMVGQAWQTIMEEGLCEIVLRPIWDPADRPGYLCEMDVYRPTFAGRVLALQRPPFYWDRSGHDLVNIVRTVEGRERANNVVFFVGGNAAGKLKTDLATSGASIVRFGDQWNLETRTRTLDGDSEFRQAGDDLIQRAPGYFSWNLSPTPEFTLSPFEDYNLGTRVIIYHSNRLREEWDTNDPRIRGFTINLSDEGIETVTDIEVWMLDI